jgi:hypothetical protein
METLNAEKTFYDALRAGTESKRLVIGVRCRILTFQAVR